MERACAFEDNYAPGLKISSEKLVSGGIKKDQIELHAYLKLQLTRKLVT